MFRRGRATSSARHPSRHLWPAGGCIMKPIIIATAIIASLLPLAVPAQECVEYDDYFHWVRDVDDVTGCVDAVHHQVGFDGYTYLSCAEGIKVLDSSSQADPILLTTVAVPAGDARRMHIDNGRLFVATGGHGLAIYDLADPAAPTLLGDTGVDGFSEAVFAVGVVAYVVGDNPELKIVNIGDPTHPFPTSYDLNILGRGEDIVVTDGHAYVAERYEGLVAVDVVPLSDMHEVGFVGTGGASGVCLSGDELYVAGHDGLYVVQIDNPANPQILGHADNIGDLRDVTAFSGRAYTVSYGHGVQSYDVTDHLDPRLVGQLEFEDGTRGVTTLFGIANIYVVGDGPMRVVRTINHACPAPFGDVDLPDRPLATVRDGRHVYVAAGEAGLQVIDLQHPAGPRVIGQAATSQLARDVDVAGSRVYVVTGTGGMEVFDISNPAAPTLAYTFTLADIIAQEIEVVGSQAYLIDGVFRLRVVDVSEPDSASLMGTAVIDDYSRCLAVVGELAYTATSDERLCIVDVSVPAAPYRLSSTSLSWLDVIFGLDASPDGMVYLACETRGLLVVDATDPVFPEVIGEYQVHEQIYDVEVVEPYVYVLDLVGGVRVHHASGPAQLDWLGSFYHRLGHRLEADDTCLMVMDDDGVAIGPAQCGAVTEVAERVPAAATSLAVAPNPFNPRVRVSFAIAHGGLARVDVYDLAGRRIATLAEQSFAAGRHTLTWNGEDRRGRTVPSGTYLVRLVTGSEQRTRKVTLSR
ncbi:T9SS type A sorting domain-containing protein [bacterium]|nr:T9SS type A sorting domain-containing protein [bacterium]